MASPQRSKTESMNAPSGLACPVARARVPSNMSNTPPAKTTMPPMAHSLAPSRTAPATVMAKPTRVSASGVRPALPMASATGSKVRLIRSRPAFERVIGSAHDAEDGPLARGDLVEGLRTEADDDLAPVALGRDETGVAQALDIMGDERLGQSDVLDELRDGRRAIGQAADDAETIDVGQRLVERAQAAEEKSVDLGGHRII